MRTFVAALLALVALAAPARAGEMERLLPADTMVYVSVENAADLVKTFKAHPLGKLLAEPAMQAFLEKPTAWFEKQLAVVQAELGGAKIEDALGMLSGQVALGVRPGAEIMELGTWHGVLVADVGENTERLRAWVKGVEDAGLERGGLRRFEEEVRGIPVVRYVKTAADATTTGEDVQAAYFLHEGLWAVANAVDPLRDVIARRLGLMTEGALADHASFKRVAEACGPGEIAFYVGLHPFLGQAFEKVAAEAAAFIGPLGLEGLKAFGGRFGLHPGGIKQRFFAHYPGPPQGLFVAAAAANTTLDLPAFVPEGVHSAMTMSIDMPRVWSEVMGLLGAVGGREQIDAVLADFEERMGVSVQRDLVAHLGKTMTFYQFPAEVSQGRPDIIVEGVDPDDPDALGPSVEVFQEEQPRVVIALEAKSAEPLERALGTMLGQMGEPATHMGVTLWDLSGMGVPFTVAVTSGHVVIATERSDLEALVAAASKEGFAGLTRSAAYREAMAPLPRSRMMVSFSDHRATLDMLAAIPMQGFADLSKFPADLVKSYLRPSAGVVVRQEDGWLIDALMPLVAPK